MSDIFYKDKITIEDITDNCHVGFIYGNIRYKIVKADDDNFASFKEETGKPKIGHSKSKSNYLKSIKDVNLKKAHIFRDEETLNNWLNKRI